jgi:hypothetical protein
MAKKKVKSPPKKRRPIEREAPAPAPQIVVLYELRGLAGVRFHSDHVELARARIAAQHLISSTEVEQAWILKDVEIVRAAGNE